MGRFTKEKRDIYYRKAKEEGFRARSAYKLLQIDERYSVFKTCERVIDLCAAPGSWSQLISRKLRSQGINLKNDVKIISVDLQDIAPIEDVCLIKGDITKQSTVSEIFSRFQGAKADMVVCDGAPDVTGFHDIDQYVQSQLLVAALNIAVQVLKEDGVFVAKVFLGSDSIFMKCQFQMFFSQVDIVKPKSSRASSVENFIVCRFFKKPYLYCLPLFSTFQGFNTIQLAVEATQRNELKCLCKEKAEEYEKSQAQANLNEAENKLKIENLFKEDEILKKENEKYYKFITCGDLSGFDEQNCRDWCIKPFQDICNQNSDQITQLITT